jgi:hypothetical protein
MTYRILIFFFLFSCSGPSQTDFYRDEMADYDVWRLPIIKPYELVTAICCEGWNFGGYLSGKGDPCNFNLDSLGFENGYILLQGVGSGSVPKENYCIINVENDSIKAFESRKDFIKYKKKLNLSAEMHSVVDVYWEWKQTKKLPWDTTWVGEKKAG